MTRGLLFLRWAVPRYANLFPNEEDGRHKLFFFFLLLFARLPFLLSVMREDGGRKLKDNNLPSRRGGNGALLSSR